jgi:hypothetical protein
MVLIVTLFLLGGCGDSGDNGVSGGNGTNSELKGFWSGSQGTGTASVIVLANGETWMASLDSSNAITSFAHLQTQISGANYSSSGTQYILQTGKTEAASVIGTFKNKATITGTATAPSGIAALNLTYNPRYEITVRVADAVGSWTGTFGGASSSRTIIVAETGKLTGTSSTGCSYSGTLLPRSSDPAVFDVTYTETCVVGTPQVLSGIATVNEAKTALFITAITSDKTGGAIFIGAK